ncbi:hypothetical protein COW36_03935 [bacterium (Candidatus Blackallbacteria) CG17_big_fil_post_rev_8_21_14_2_50_48_46]|uniref:Uncharacterized protein n=1 Tax=bacterium (Candidatus Blackallbacteria) CG17_big_fil_post_rev_8_21_14_2_50_48_46 TaxID=2014261 RepID=A0A2M7G8L2_9BACT|nr:MAG: hypothetical protein COW64_05010 [bacterium (Candidatus Blackallbacteria) CG18_big_fil_WC_8_21_14_2_50_49_26]PIW18449.1 MAG: hypothetical protein COW36_03935 [bacterium (Candidatus Blackallbacteria) CG17_big_fil_post_rev_8_21_14_2_50_48_46]PIW46566.1 MAG: hypothetical protein COW20_16745 [bacterium (Candidatus Blackallbacteria) CG13_big_fil_rev_8_21_14_2_50_49_14]
MDPLPESTSLFVLFDQKLENLRGRTDEILSQVHLGRLDTQNQENRLNQTLQKHTLELKELESQLQYLSHKTALQLKEIENANSQFKRDVEARMQDIHFSTREELSSLSRRLEVLEKLIL